VVESRMGLASAMSRITDLRSLAGADDQRWNYKDRHGPGPVQRMVKWLSRARRP
jgi:hypothetical protein